MGSLGSASIKLNLDRSQFDSDLKKLQATDAGQIAYRIKLDTKDFERQIKGLSKLVSPVFIPLEIDTKTFDQQIKKLNSSIDPVKVDLAPNVKDFQEKLRRLSKITPVTVDIKVDEAKVKQQFEQIGKYAADGFTQGFSGAEGAGKSAIDSMVKSVNKQLGIQSPSKVFREIGKYAIAGLMQGLDSVDESKLKGVTNKIESYFKKSKIKINVDIDASGISGKVKVQASTPSEKPADFAKNITKSIEEGFQKAKPKANFLGAIFGGLGSLITAPLTATLRGAFEGIGTPLGLQLGTGVSKAIQSTLGQSIGSLELISQRAVEKSLQAIPAAQSAIVEVIKANPIGGAIAKQLELLQRTLELYSINLSPQKAVKSLASDEERAVASSSAAFTGVEAQFKATKKAKASAASEFLDITNNQEGVKKIVPLIKQKEEDLAKKQKKLQAAQQAIAALEIRLQQIAELPIEQREVAETSIKSKMVEFSEVLAGGNVSIEQDIKSIASLKKTGSDYFEKLNNQIKLLADLGIEQELSSQSAELLKSMEIFEQMAAAQKSVQIAQGSVKTNAKTSTAIRGKKLTKLTDLATSAKTNLDSALTSPDATPEQIQKLQKRATAANKALDLYKLEISDPAKEIEKLNKKLAAANEVLAENIQELQSRLTKAIPALFRDASQEVVKVGNLNEITQNRPSAGQLAIERQALTSEQEARKALELKNLKQQKADSTKNLPKLYVDAVQSVSRIVTGKNLDREKIPNIVPSAEVAGRGDYNAKANTYRIRPDLYQQLETGDIDQVAEEAIGNIVHEIFHAFQHSFGKAIADNTGQLAVDITPTPEELLKVANKVESSVAIQPDERKPLSRQLETGANVFQLRNTDRVRDELKRNQLKGQALSLGGIAGNKIGLTDVNKLIDSVSGFLQEAKNLGIDVSKQKAKYIGIIKDIRARADAVGAKSVNIDSLPTIEIEGIVKRYQEILKAVDDAKTEVLGLTEKLPQTQALTQELVIQNSKPQLARVAKELGIKGVSGKDKQGLADAIIGTGVSPEAIRAKLPVPTVATEKILSESQKLLQLPSQELEKSTKYAVNSFGLKLKAIAKNPDDKNKVVELQKVLGEIDELEKTYIAAKVKTLDESLQNVFQGRILGLQKQRVAAIYQLKPLAGNSSQQRVAQGSQSATQPTTDAEISSKRKGIFDIGLSKPGKNKANEKIKRGQEELKLATENFQKIFKAVIIASGLSPEAVEGRSPAVSFLGAIAKGGGQYTGRGNRIALPIDSRKKLALGKLSLDELDTIIHEVRHAIQLDFGRAQEADIASGKAGIPLLSSKRKTDKRRAEASTRAYRQQYKENHGYNPSDAELRSVMALEEDAVAFAAELAPSFRKNLKNILKPQKGSKPAALPFKSKNQIPPAPWDIDPLLDFRHRLPQTTPLFSTPLSTTPPPPPGFNLPIGRTLPPPPPGFYSPIGKPTQTPPSPPGFDLPITRTTLPPPPPGFNLPIGKPKTTLPPPPPGFDLPIGTKSARLTPPAPPDFNLPIKVKQLVDKVKDSGELFKIVTDIQKDQTKNILQKLKEYDRIIKIYDDLEAEKAKQNQALDDKFDPEKIDRQRETIRQRAKLSAKLERKYGMEGLAPEILPDRINDSGEVGKSPSILQGIKDIFKSLDNSVAKRVKKRAAQLAIEVDTAIAPSLEAGAIDAGARGDKVEQKQYQKLARQSRAATKGIAKILESPGDLTDKQVKQLDRLTAQLEKVYDAIGRPLPSQGFLESIGIGASGAIGLIKNLGGVIKGFLAFSIGMWAQNFFGSIAQESFKAFVELDRLKTALNFASGGAAGGAQNLAFVRKTVEDLKVPLKASTEGFVQLAAAARGSAMEGKGTRELFTGISQASTVLSLSADNTQGAILALSQMISKGKVSAEELRCYDSNTEVLASRGWVRWDEVSDRDLFASQNLETGEIEFQLPTRTIRYRYTGLMLRVNSPSVNLLVTPDHRMVVRGANDTKFKIVKAKDLEAQAYFYLTDFDSDAEVLVEPSSLEWVEFDDEVFCVEVPFTTLYVRRSGKTCWSGNSQLGEHLPGAMGIAARSMGVTEVEFQRLLDTGQLLSQDFLPKFAGQLKSEFGDAAKDAAGNAQSAIFGVQNAFLSLQQGIGEGVSPAATAGLNVFAVILKGLSSVAKELGFILLGVTIALSVKMVASLQAVIAQLIATKLATGTLSGGMQALGQTINNSFSAKLAVGIFAVLEVVNLLNQAINTELVQSFQKAADAAKRSAEETKKFFQKPKPEASGGVERFLDKYAIAPINSKFGTKISTFAEKENAELERGKTQGLDPVATNGVGQFLDKYLIGFLNQDLGPIKAIKLKTWGQYERDSSANNIQEQGLSNTESLGDARLLLAQFKTGTGEAGKLRPIDAQLKVAEEQRAILQAKIKRDFVDKGQAAPAEFKQKLEASNLKINGLNDQRAEAGKPLTFLLNDTTRKIDSIKTQLEQLKDPDKIANAGGEAAADIQRQNLKIQLKPQTEFKAKLEEALGSLRIDPIRAFTQSLRELNLALAEGQEKNKENLSKRKLTNSREAIAGFSTNKLATKQLAFKNADDEYKSAQIDEANSVSSVKTYEEAASKPDFQTTLKRLGLTPDASVAKIDDVLKNTTDEADKGILEKLKAGRESKAKLPEIQAATLEAKTKRSQVVQDNAFFKIDDSAANSRAATQKAENQKITGIKKALEAKVLVEEVANEKIARIQLASTRSQQKSLNQQLQALHVYHDQGAISAEKFAEKERELTTEQTNLEKQEAENRLAVQSAVLTRRLKEIEFFNKKAEALTATRATDSTRKAKEKLLSSGLTPQAQDQFALDQTKVDATTASDKVNQVKDRIAQNKELYKSGLKDARDFMLEQYALNQELASANLAVVDQKIAGEEKYREVVERNIQRIMQAEENRFKSLTSQLDFQKAGLDLYNQSLERTSKLEESRYNLAKALTDAATAPLETKRDNANRALDLSRKLKDDNLDPGVRSVVSSQLSQMGFGTNELAILAQRNQIEDEIAAKKLESLKLEQEYQRKALALDLQRQRIAAETAVYDAESAKLAAAKSKLDAEGAMRIAQIKKDPIAIESAKVGLEIAGREIELGDKRLDNAQKNLGIQDELVKNATMTQELNQRTAIDQQLASDKARKQGEGVEKAESQTPKKEGEEQSGKEDKGKRRGRRRGMIGETFVENGRTIKDGVDVTNYHYDEALNRSQGNPPVSDFELPKRIEVNQLPELNRKPGEDLFGAYGRYNDGLKLKGKSADMPPTDLVTGVLNKAGIQSVSDSGYSQFAESLKMANQGIEQRLDALNSAIITLANTPRSLSISSPNPIDDAADFMNRISRGQVVAAGA